jgi:hypothetical protein
MFDASPGEHEVLTYQVELFRGETSLLELASTIGKVGIGTPPIGDDLRDSVNRVFFFFHEVDSLYDVAGSV